MFLSAFLLFQIQFIVARRLLPWFGGVPAVWTTCMLFFQLLLLVGYAYAHLVPARLGARWSRRVHVGLLALSILFLLGRVAGGVPAVLPGEASKPADPGWPVRDILETLLSSVGFPYALLATTGPLLQSWHAGSRPGVSPYRLYAWSNLGSLLALVTYPVAVEPLLRLRSQATLWAFGYGAFAAVVSLIALREAVPEDARHGGAGTRDHAPGIAPSLYALWFGLAAGPSILLLAVTNQMCQEVAVIPLLWVLPLGLYLASLVACFDSDRGYARGPWALALVVSAAGSSIVLAKGPGAGVAPQVAVLGAVLLCASMVCHGELARLKPPAHQLTSFYLAVAGGGAAGGILVGLLAPRVFRAFWEFQLGLLACGALYLAAVVREESPALQAAAVVPSIVGAGLALASCALLLPSGPGRMLAAVAGVMAAATLALGRRTFPPRTLARVAVAATWLVLGCQLLGQAIGSVVHARWVGRNFYGVLRVDERTGGQSGEPYLALKHGQVTHGLQYRAPALRREPTAYFGRTSGIGRALHVLRERAAGRPLRLAVVGLGVGTLAAYGEAGDELRFYEINPQVIALARDPNGFFRYLADTAAAVSIAAGDARITIEREAVAGAGDDVDLLAVDAFNSDSIPVHLLTREALDVYLRRLRRPDGVLALHLSNRFLDLRPVAVSLARERGLAWASIATTPSGELEFPSVWVLLSRDAAILAAPPLRDAAEPAAAIAPGPLWTDDHTDLLRVLRR